MSLQHHTYWNAAGSVEPTSIIVYIVPWVYTMCIVYITYIVHHNASHYRVATVRCSRVYNEVGSRRPGADFSTTTRIECDLEAATQLESVADVTVTLAAAATRVSAAELDEGLRMATRGNMLDAMALVVPIEYFVTLTNQLT